MIGLTSHHRYFLYDGICDMRKGFDGLSGIITSQMQYNPLDGGVYIFVNRRRDRMKMLVWESGGFMLYYKRLEQGTFELPTDAQTGVATIDWETLILMLSGISLVQKSRKKRYKQVSNSS